MSGGRLRFVDEYRDPAAARALLARITELAGRRALQVHGGVRRAHAHHLPPRHRARAAAARSSSCTGRGARCASSPWAGSTTPSPSPSTPGVIFTTFGDMMRVPGLGREPARRQGARAPTSASSTRRSTPCASPSENPGARGGVLRGRLRDDRAVHGGDPAAGPRGRRGQLQRVLQPRDHRPAHQGHPRVAGPAARRVPRAGPRLHRGRPAPLPLRPRGLRQAAGDRRLRAARHPPGHRACSSRRSARAAARSRTSTPGACATRATPARWHVLAEVFELRPHFEWRGLGFISQSALEAPPRVRSLGRRAALRRCPACGSPTRRPASAARCSRA